MINAKCRMVDVHLQTETTQRMIDGLGTMLDLEYGFLFRFMARGSEWLFA